VETIPTRPASGHRATSRAPLRFEDISQDGRIVLGALPTTLGVQVWRDILARSPSGDVPRERRIVPVLARLVVDGEPGPFSVLGELDVEGMYRLARTDSGRLMFDMWVDIHSTLGRTYGTVEGQGHRALAGRVLAEHVLTRPFAPPGGRRVETLDFEGAPEVVETRADPVPPEQSAALPEGAMALEPEMRPEAAARTFGLLHTDSNKHVNSLTYLRIIEEASLRRFASLGRDAETLGRFVDISYRKPCFAGQTVRIVQRAYEAPAGRLGVIAMVFDEAEARGGEAFASARPHVCARMEFEG
jgi:acyl-CoA thioesterase FadM